MTGSSFFEEGSKLLTPAAFRNAQVVLQAIGGSTNDVGVITLPGNAGHVALAVFVKDSSAEIPEREKIIAALDVLFTGV